MAELRPKFENIKIGHRNYRVPSVNSGEANMAVGRGEDRMGGKQQTNWGWGCGETSQKMIENDIQRKKLTIQKKVETGNQWEGQWGGDARALKASELAASIDNGDFSHFVSIPLYRDENLMKKLNDFKEKVGQNLGERTSSLCLSDVRTAHLTLLMLRLNTQERQKKAIECIKNCEDVLRLLADGIKKFNIADLNYFGKSDKMATYVYASIKDPIFSNFCNEATNVLVKEFIDFGLLDENDLLNIKKDAEGKYTPDKLHISLMKTANTNATFDASQVLDTFKHFEFYGAKFHTIDISSKQEVMASNGYFLPLQSFTVAIQ